MIILELRQKHQRIKLKSWLSIANLSKSTFFEWKEKIESNFNKDLEWIELIKESVEQSNDTYGYRRVTLDLQNKGYIINHKKVRRIMKENGLTCTKFTRKTRKKYSSYKGTIGKVAKNELNREFNVKTLNTVWVTDITEFSIPNDHRRLYLSPLLDIANGEIISYRIGYNPTTKLTNDMLDQALEKLPSNHKLMIHSDQGFHYQHHSWVLTLENENIKQSMSRKGNCLDNAPMENFFGLLKQEMFHGEEFKSLNELKQAIIKYIYWYNNFRIKQKLNGLSPVQYRQQAIQIT
ncbi:MAG: IS3 family transposase [Acholeplasmataceae bacterium]